MINRATGAFLVALVAIGYLFGPFSGTDFLVGLAVAGAIGVATGVWLGREERKPPPEVFDERATRRAVRRGVLRTALVAVVWVVFGAIVLQIGSAIWQGRGDRRDHFETVSRYGFLAAHPGFRATSWGCCNTNLRSMAFSLSLEPRTAGGLRATVPLELRLDLRGRLEDEGSFDLPKTGLDTDVGTGGLPPSKREVRNLLARLPEQIVATGVAELARPLPPSEFFRLLERHGIEYPHTHDLPVYLEPGEGGGEPRLEGPGPRREGRFFEERVSWPTPALAQFQAWVKQLRSSDDRLLDGLGLPSSARLRKLAAEPRVYGFVLDRMRPEQVRRVIDDPEVRSVEIRDVGFDLGLAS